MDTIGEILISRRKSSVHPDSVHVIGDVTGSGVFNKSMFGDKQVADLKSVDDALSAVTVAEATLKADQATVTNIQVAIDTATAPLPAAKDKVATDITTYNSAVDDAVASLTASKIPVGV